MDVRINSTVGGQPYVQEMARAMRAGLTARTFTTPSVSPDPGLGQLPAACLPDREPELVALRDVVRTPVPPPSRRLGYLVKPWRRLARALMRPWLDHQTKFNITIGDILGQLRSEFLGHSSVTSQHVNTLTDHSRRVAADLDQRLTAVRTHTEQCCQELYREQRALRDAVEQTRAAMSETLRLEVERTRQEIAVALRANEELTHQLDSERKALTTSLAEKDAAIAAERSRAEATLTESVNRELGYAGTIAQHGLFFNPPINIHYDPKEPRVASITERIVEHIFVHSKLPPPPGRVLDLGCAESTNALEMASLGYSVVGVDLRPLTIKHPQLRTVVANLVDMPFPDESFDVVVSLSTIEHVGLGWYSPEEKGTSQQQVAAEIRRVLRPGGTLILTVPFGQPGQTPVHRIFDRKNLMELLVDFNVRELSFAVREGETWTRTDDVDRAESCDSNERVSAVALVVAERE